MINKLIMEMVRFYAGDPHQIQHFVKVHAYSKLIGEIEKVPPDIMEVLEAAAIIHDIGIKPAREKYGQSHGKLQEKEGPAFAEEILKKLNFSEDLVARVSYLVAHHHTYSSIDGIDFQILVEADLLVNLHEKNESKKNAQTVLDKIFKTETGKDLFTQMFLEG